jgi:hypothetical protein
MIDQSDKTRTLAKNPSPRRNQRHWPMNRKPALSKFPVIPAWLKLTIYSGGSVVPGSHGGEAEDNEKSDVAESLLDMTLTREFQSLQIE